MGGDSSTTETSDLQRRDHESRLRELEGQLSDLLQRSKVSASMWVVALLQLASAPLCEHSVVKEWFQQGEAENEAVFGWHTCTSGLRVAT